MLEENQGESVRLLDVAFEDIQGIGQEVFGRKLCKGEVEVIIQRFKLALDVRVQWRSLLKQCMEEGKGMWEPGKETK